MCRGMLRHDTTRRGMLRHDMSCRFIPRVVAVRRRIPRDVWVTFCRRIMIAKLVKIRLKLMQRSFRLPGRSPVDARGQGREKTHWRARVDKPRDAPAYHGTSRDAAA
ncbi:jg17952 [Pararge aegeria aegeria]|uniref:Jg17952 protein n=1 Tax=Pararge aegeria aegeria TaxID=348720 RepID=A0A8S4S3N6_9NEOP|nr:jg17952 [Pararge aegeria aegeria]